MTEVLEHRLLAIGADRPEERGAIVCSSARLAAMISRQIALM